MPMLCLAGTYRILSTEPDGDSIRFYPDGSSTGGRNTGSSGEGKYLVDVDWLTGRVSIAD